MTYQEAVNAVLRACSEVESTDIVASATGTTQDKFRKIFDEAYRFANTWKRWPWNLGNTTVTAAGSGMFTLDSTVLDIVSVTYNTTVLSEQYTYEDILRLISSSDLVTTGSPRFMTMFDFSTIYVYPEPTDTNPELNIVVYGYHSTPDITANATVLDGPPQYHDAVVHLAYAIAQDKHFGDAVAAKSARAEADKMLQRVFSKARKHKVPARFRV